jgi:hypothetical protein
MFMNLAPAVIFFSKPVTLRSSQPGVLLNGRFTPGGYIDSTIQATVQPATAKDLNILPEGERQKQIKAFWSLTEMRMSADTINTDSDLLVEKGKSYKVIHAFDRSDNGYYKVLAEFLPTG